MTIVESWADILMSKGTPSTFLVVDSYYLTSLSNKKLLTARSENG